VNTLNLLIFLPLLTAAVLSLPIITARAARTIAVALSLVMLVITLFTLSRFDPSLPIQMVTKSSWIETYGISYHIGADPFSLIIMMVLSLIMPVTFLFIRQEPKGILIALLIAQSGGTGALFSLDLILFYLFWEVMLFPIFLMIGLYGSGERVKIAIELTLYTIFGSVAMFLSILILGVQYFDLTGRFSFDLFDIARMIDAESFRPWAFFGFLVAFFIKIPLFGFHGWLKRSYEAAPAATLIILSGVMAKLGVFALYRFVFTLFPDLSRDLAPFVIALGLFGMIYFGIAALRQEKFRSLFAYSSASHMSLIIVGLFTFNLYGQSGSIYLITAHALATAGIFLLLERINLGGNSDSVSHYSGIIRTAPRLGVLFTLLALSFVGIPGTSGFVAELLIIYGAFAYTPLIGFITATTVLIAMIFILWLLQQVLFGPSSPAAERIKDLNRVETVAMGLLVFVIFGMGIYPDPFLSALSAAPASSGVRL
jgi:NADH-quinone oxidoreductase subunit M